MSRVYRVQFVTSLLENINAREGIKTDFIKTTVTTKTLLENINAREGIKTQGDYHMNRYYKNLCKEIIRYAMNLYNTYRASDFSTYEKREALAGGVVKVLNDMKNDDDGLGEYELDEMVKYSTRIMRRLLDL